MAVATVMPSVALELGGLDTYGWAFSGFMLASLVGAISAGQIADRDNGDPEAASRRSSGDNSDSEPLRQWRSRPGSGIGDRETDGRRSGAVWSRLAALGRGSDPAVPARLGFVCF